MPPLLLDSFKRDMTYRIVSSQSVLHNRLHLKIRQIAIFEQTQKIKQHLLYQCNTRTPPERTRFWSTITHEPFIIFLAYACQLGIKRSTRCHGRGPRYKFIALYMEGVSRAIQMLIIDKYLVRAPVFQTFTAV